MAGLCKPYAAELLVKTLKQEIGLPIHFHTHDTGGVQAASILKAAEADLDIADAAMAPMSGGTSQPNLNSLVEALRFTPRDTGLDYRQSRRDRPSTGEAVREFYAPFESPMLAATADLYQHEMPGGQYTNLYQQAQALGLADRWPEVCRDLRRREPDVRRHRQGHADFEGRRRHGAVPGRQQSAPRTTFSTATASWRFPQSVIDLLGGRMGQPPAAFRPTLQNAILRGEKPLVRPPRRDAAAGRLRRQAAESSRQARRRADQRDVMSYLLYPKVFEEYRRPPAASTPTPASCRRRSFFYGLEPGEEIAVDIEPGKTLIIKFLTVGEPHADGRRTVFFELNGQPREVTVTTVAGSRRRQDGHKADPANPKQVGASMPGMVVTVSVKPGDRVKKGEKLVTLEAMKMQTTVVAERDGKIDEVFVKPGSQVKTADLLLTIQ